ncbi:GDSL lipase [Euphorbia peplus]|nr:GDSL lipase [Euphorbia peplus]
MMLHFYILFLGFQSLLSCGEKSTLSQDQSSLDHLRGDTSSSTSYKTGALFIFGDSTVDTGNNNYINTIPEHRADVEPYGRNGFFHGPTGRFSDGYLTIDYIAEYAKLPIIPPFLQPSADYKQGANFASGGSGVLPETNQGTVIDLATQLKNFKEVKKSLKEKLGEDEAQEIIEGAVYFISTGSNDYLGGYLGNPLMQQNYLPEIYVGMVIGNFTGFIEELYEIGARKFAFLSLIPLGCLPVMRALNPKAEEDGCFEGASALARAHNNGVECVVRNLEFFLKGFKYCNFNTYDWLLQRISNPSKHGFKDGVNACCGSGPYGGVFSCGGNKKMREYELCENGDDHIWWDSFHPTQKMHQQLAKALWNSTPQIEGGPHCNLQNLFFHNHKITIADIEDAPLHNYAFNY